MKKNDFQFIMSRQVNKLSQAFASEKPNFVII